MSLVRGIIGAIIGGAIGAAIWAAISYFTHYEIRWIATGLGALTGFGMAIGARGEADDLHGIVAVVIALAAIAAGKFAAVQFAVNAMTSTISQNIVVTDEIAQCAIANQLLDQRTDGGSSLKWPNGKDADSAETINDYPDTIAKDAMARWNAMTPDAQDAYKQQTADYMKSQVQGFSGVASQAGFLASFSFYDIIWVIFAGWAAFHFGSGANED